jgi:omega-hydroxy-beta-dihydromenaquinone-9 sulfotransferase
LNSNYLTAGIRLPVLLRVLGKNSFSLGPKYLPRLAFLLQSSLWSSLFSGIEKARFHKETERTKIVESPVFIVGHWRTGSTFLHQLMSADPALYAPTLFDVAQPECFLSSYNYFRPVFSLFVDKHRPMDNVRLGMNEPQEDEYAMYRLTGFSPLEKLIFPTSQNYFLDENTAWLPAGQDLIKWEEKLRYFFQKLTLKSKRRIVSKNPFNSMRIEVLSSIFPDATFIHIVRNPLDVIPSTIHMWDIVQRQNRLNSLGKCPGTAEVSSTMAFMEKALTRQLTQVSPGRQVTVRYEDLVNAPVNELKRIYQSTGLPFHTDFEKKINQFLSGIAGFEKNRFHLEADEKTIIRQNLHEYLQQFGYSAV